jgi:hypothetical protein
MRKLLSSGGVKFLFVVLYIASNVWGALTILGNNRLIADHAGWPAPNAEQIFSALILIVGIYLLMLFVGNEKKEIELRKKNRLYGRVLARIIFSIQALFIVFIFVYSAARAGDIEKAGGVFRFLFYVINPDMLFLIYYAATMYAKVKIPHRISNLVLFFVSNLMRGWIGPILFIGFISAISWVQSPSRKVTTAKIFVFTISASVLFVIFSFFLYVKIALRGGFDAVFNLIADSNYIDVLSGFFEILFSRLQLISSVLFQITHKEELNRFIENGVVGNFYTEGLPQQTMFNIFGIFPGENLNLFLWKNYIPGYFFESQTTIQAGLAGWLYIISYYWILPFIAYILFLVFVNLKLINFFGGNGLRHLSWFAVLVFLIPGWFGAYISFIWSLFIFILITVLIQNKRLK